MEIDDEERTGEPSDADLQYEMGYKYAEGRGLPQDYTQAVICFTKAAQASHVGAQMTLGQMYADGRGVPQDDFQAAFWYQRAARERDVEAHRELGRRYSEGRGVPQDYILAARWCERASEIEYWKAVELGLDGVSPDFRVGEMKDFILDYIQAVLWYERGDAYETPINQFTLGWMYLRGKGVQQDAVRAAACLERAARHGLAEAQYWLGGLYVEGQGVPQDDSRAAFWYEKAAQASHAEAQFALGRMYAEGRGVRRNDTRAAFWYERAARGCRIEAHPEVEDLEHSKGSRLRLLLDYIQAPSSFGGCFRKGLRDAQLALDQMYAEGRGRRPARPRP